MGAGTSVGAQPTVHGTIRGSPAASGHAVLRAGSAWRGALSLRCAPEGACAFESPSRTVFLHRNQRLRPGLQAALPVHALGTGPSMAFLGAGGRASPAKATEVEGCGL